MRKKAKGWWPKVSHSVGLDGHENGNGKGSEPPAKRIKWQMPNGIPTWPTSRSRSRNRSIRGSQVTGWTQLAANGYLHCDTGMGKLTRGNCVSEMQWKIIVQQAGGTDICQLRKNWYESASSRGEWYCARAQCLTAFQIRAINVFRTKCEGKWCEQKRKIVYILFKVWESIGKDL